jgi:hypothetical protein
MTAVCDLISIEFHFEPRGGYIIIASLFLYAFSKVLFLTFSKITGIVYMLFSAEIGLKSIILRIVSSVFLMVLFIFKIWFFVNLQLVFPFLVGEK